MHRGPEEVSFFSSHFSLAVRNLVLVENLWIIIFLFVFLYLVGNEETLQNMPEKKASAAVFKHYRAQFLERLDIQQACMGPFLESPVN